MRSIRSLRTTTVVALLVVVALATGTAMAVTVADSSVPDESKVGNVVTASANVTDLYEGSGSDEWTLVVETELKNPRWTITYYNQTGGIVDTTEVEGEQIVSGKTIAPPIDKIRVVVDGDTPEVESYTYEGNQTFLGLRIAQNVGGADDTIRGWQVTHYTDASREARQALDAAREAISEARSGGADVSDAQSLFENAKQTYNDGAFQSAQDLANDAKSKATQASQSAGGLPLIPIVGGLAVVVVLVGAGLYYYRQQQQSGSKLR